MPDNQTDQKINPKAWLPAGAPKWMHLLLDDENGSKVEIRRAAFAAGEPRIMPGPAYRVEAVVRGTEFDHIVDLVDGRWTCTPTSRPRFRNMTIRCEAGTCDHIRAVQHVTRKPLISEE